MATDGSNVYVAGIFGTAGTNAASGLVKWDGTNWSAVAIIPSDIYGDLQGSQVALVGSNIYVSGNFTIPEANATNLACWNGNKWTSPGGPLADVSISGLFTIGDTLYVFGYFKLNYVAFGPVCRWDGVNWTQVLPDFIGDISDLTTDGTNLYFADFFYEDFSFQMEKWDGTNLVAMGDEFVSKENTALAASGTNVYLAAADLTNFYKPLLYSWDGTRWQPFGTPFESFGYIDTILPVRGNVFVAGSFTSIGGITAGSVAEWNGSSWLSLDGGVTYDPRATSVSTMVSLGRRLFVGGQFTSAGPVESGNFAIWNETPEIRLRDSQRQPNGSFTFDVYGLPGDQLEIQCDDSGTGWTPVNTMTLTNSIQIFSVAPSVNASSRFYRARFMR